jgi:hypothetical protein
MTSRRAAVSKAAEDAAATSPAPSYVDATSVLDELPQPYRMISKVLSSIVDGAWAQLKARAAVPGVGQHRQRIPTLEHAWNWNGSVPTQGGRHSFVSRGCGLSTIVRTFVRLHGYFVHIQHLMPLRRCSSCTCPGSKVTPTAFSMSSDGTLVFVGTTTGTVLVVDAHNDSKAVYPAVRVFDGTGLCAPKHVSVLPSITRVPAPDTDPITIPMRRQDVSSAPTASTAAIATTGTFVHCA